MFDFSVALIKCILLGGLSVCEDREAFFKRLQIQDIKSIYEHKARHRTRIAVSGFFSLSSAAPVVGPSLAGRVFYKASPRYKVSPMGANMNKQTQSVDSHSISLSIYSLDRMDASLKL